MRFYTQQHQYHCGIDLHARSMYVCILDQSGEILLHRNMRANPEAFLKAVAPTSPARTLQLGAVRQLACRDASLRMS